MGSQAYILFTLVTRKKIRKKYTTIKYTKNIIRLNIRMHKYTNNKIYEQHNLQNKKIYEQQDF